MPKFFLGFFLLISNQNIVLVLYFNSLFLNIQINEAVLFQKNLYNYNTNSKRGFEPRSLALFTRSMLHF